MTRRVAKPISTLPADRLDELRACAVLVTPKVLTFDADSPCYKAAFPAPAPHAAERMGVTPVQPVPREQWPLSVRVVARLAKGGERGVGTTLTRLLAGVGGDIYKRIMAEVGVDCGCSAKAASLDARFPY